MHAFPRAVGSTIDVDMLRVHHLHGVAGAHGRVLPCRSKRPELILSHQGKDIVGAVKAITGLNVMFRVRPHEVRRGGWLSRID